MSYMAVKCPTFNLKQVMFVSFSGGQRSFELTRVKLWKHCKHDNLMEENYEFIFGIYVPHIDFVTTSVFGVGKSSFEVPRSQTKNMVHGIW